MLFQQRNARASDLERLDIIDRVGTGEVHLTVWGQAGTPDGAPIALLAPGFQDHEGKSREPAAKDLALKGIRAGVIRHQRRAGRTALHPREQRAMDVKRAVRIANRIYRPSVMVIDGHSYGGPNSNDAINYLIKTYRSGDDKPAQLAVVHEAAPGLGPEPFDESEVDIGKELERMAQNPRAMASLAISKLASIATHPLDVLTDAGEAASLHGIHIQSGKEDLLVAGVFVSDYYYEDDGLVAVPDACRNAPDVTVYPGSHLESFFNPDVLSRHILERVLPELGVAA